MADVQAQISIPYYTGLPADVSVNVWNFEAPDAEDAAPEIGAFLLGFYTTISAFCSPILDFTQVSAKLYNRADPEPRTPFIDTVNDLGDDNLANSGLPEEVSLCLSFHGVYDSGSPKARRRGRIYLPPLDSDQTITSTSGRTVFQTAFITAVLNAYEAAWAELTTAGTVHAVWSTVDETSYPVVTAWMDDAPDTQRRRGPLATYRDTRNGPF
jgi:hypothetical protein